MRRSTPAALPVLLLVAALSTSSLPARADAAGPEPGGRAVVHRAGGKIIRSHPRARGVVYRTGTRAIEPTIGIDAKGHLFFTAGRDLDVVRSDNGGRTWYSVAPVLPTGQPAHVITLDPYIYLDESTGRLFDIDLTVACSYMSFSDDGGRSWTTNPLACGRPVNDHQTLFGGPPATSQLVGYPEVVYYCWNDFGLGTSCSRSLDGGVSWLPGSPAFLGFTAGDGQAPVDHCGGFNGHGVVDDDGTVYLPKEYCGQPWLGISRDEGVTWEQVQVASNTTEVFGSDTSIAVDRKGNLYYVYETQNQELFLTVSRDGGDTWGRPMMVGHPRVNEVTLPTIDAGDPGKVAIAYVATTQSPYPRCSPDCSSQDYNGVPWNGYLTISDNVLAKRPTFTSASVNASSDPVYRGRCDFTTRCGPILDFIDVEISPDGTAYTSLVDACMLVCVEGGSSMGDDGIVGRLVGGPLLR